MSFSVIMACHNRRPLTINAIRRAKASADAAGVVVRFTVFDDGSTDGTAQALAQEPSEIAVVQGDGTAFWARGMAAAEEAALAAGSASDSETLVWLNDDVVLDLDAFTRLKTVLEKHPDSIVAGAMREPATAGVSYSGLNRSGLHPLRFERVQPADSVQGVDTFNGNLVAVPAQVAHRLTGIDGGFSHALADIDYGLRASRLGIPVLLAAGTFGECAANQPAPIRGVIEEWRAFTGYKGGGNFASLKRILQRSNRRSWSLIIAVTYALWWARRLGRTPQGKA
ncbi:glycosyltransferase [Cryobacterium sp. SO2]|uniref:glycosyltransferase family 2 protein n=1 Tax=Cryobacterium sp. SO2 TaxID=1897060 RepID=UPI00223D82F9|nr:glycosyltransferase [Cryobacterium sp. SO2]WEO77982.1 glycosyltransferase [Cryobacterium sp. SO2]